jgi:hypothetical protein
LSIRLTSLELIFYLSTMYVGEQKENYLEKTLYEPFDAAKKEEAEIDKANAALVFMPEFIPYYPDIAIHFKLTHLQTLLYGFIRFYLKIPTLHGVKRFFYTNEQLSILFNTTAGTIANNIKVLKDKGVISASYRVNSKGGTTRFITGVVKNLPISEEPDFIKKLSPPLEPTSLNSEANKNNINNIYDHFDQFWSQYPRKVNKAKTKEIFLRLEEKDTTCILKVLADYPFSKDKQYIPHPTTWLRGRRWEDELEDEKGTAPEIGSIF